jgi:hypothetical protein
MNREQAINYLFYSGFSEEQINTIEQAFKQEPTDKNFTKADIDAIVKAINEGWELRVNEILSKIRAEIETKYGQCDICEYDSDYCGWNQVGDIADILQIIDKYKAESEE